MTVIRMSVATVTVSLATEISLCALIVYNHRLGWHKWHYNHSIKPAPGVLDLELVSGFLIGGTSAGIYASSGVLVNGFLTGGTMAGIYTSILVYIPDLECWSMDF